MDRLPRVARCAALVLTSLAALGLVAESAAAPASRSKSAAAATAYSGRAIAFHVDGVVEPIAGPIVIGDTGPLPSEGGLIEKHAADVSLGGGALTIDAVDATTSGAGPEAASATALTSYHVHFITTDHRDVYIDADYIGASASVSLNPGGHPSASSSVTVQGLRVNGEPVTVTGAANQVVNLPDAELKLVINEQIGAGEKGSGDIAVAAIHFYLCECIEGHFGLVSAGISGAGTPPEHDCGKVTGGGWITGTPSGDKGTFGVSGGIRRGEFWGHLTYVDHGLNLKVESTAVTGFDTDPSDANARIITYAVTINGETGTAAVRVSDAGEPGRDDTFAITLSTGYTASGDLGGSRPGGGNIQIHKCPPGWE